MVSPFLTRLRAVTTLTDQDLSDLAVLISPPQQVGRDRAVMLEGDSPNELHLLQDGWAARMKMLPDGRRHLCTLLVPGDLCNIDGLHLRTYDYGVVTLSSCRMATINRRSLLELCDRRPSIMHALAWLGFVDNSLLNEAAASLALRSATQRLAHLLCELKVRLAVVGYGNAAGYDFPLTQERLAEALGLTPVHTNRMLGFLREHGLVDHRGGRIVAGDWKRLEDSADFSPAYLHLEGMRAGPAA